MTFDRHRLAESLKTSGCDALVVRDPCFWTYLAGFAMPGTLARHLDWIGGPRPCFAMVTADGERSVLVDTFSFELARARLNDGVFGYEAYREDPLRKLGDWVRTRCGADARLAVDRPTSWLWHETGAEVSFKLEPAEAMLWQLMAHKTETEISRIKRACHLLDDAHASLSEAPPVQCTEASLHARIVGWCLERGSQFTHGILNVERNNVLYAGESQIEVIDGDMVRTDYVAYFDGYPGHQSRMMVRGRATSEQLDKYARLLNVHRSAIDRCRPGMTGAQIHELFGQLFAKQGMTYAAHIAGHGVGPWMHQQFPLLAAGSLDIVEAGMVIALEPFVDLWHLQDVILVGDKGNTVLSDRLDITKPLEI